MKTLALTLWGKSLSPEVTTIAKVFSVCIIWVPTITRQDLHKSLSPCLSHRHLWKAPWEGRTWHLNLLLYVSHWCCMWQCSSLLSFLPTGVYVVVHPDPGLSLYTLQPLGEKGVSPPPPPAHCLSLKSQCWFNLQSPFFLHLIPSWVTISSQTSLLLSCMSRDPVLEPYSSQRWKPFPKSSWWSPF